MNRVSGSLLTGGWLGSIEVRNRLVMAPLTRLRAAEDGTPTSMMEEYYRQRASMGLIITEGTWPVREGRTWVGQPGIASTDHIEGWRRVADAVHQEGGHIAMQIMHGGRVSHPQLTGTGRTVAPSAQAGPETIRVPVGTTRPPVPHSLTEIEIADVVQQFVTAARNAIEAGMDSVELHGANGYLIHQFLSPAANHRVDAFGGDPLRRARFAIEVTQAVAAEIGASRTAIRLAPANPIRVMDELDPADVEETYHAYARAVAPLGLAFVDILHDAPPGRLVQGIRAQAKAPLIANTRFASTSPREDATALVAEGWADAVAIGRSVIANPDLVRRWSDDQPENEPDPATFYSGGACGYTDYPLLADSERG